jgi:EEF1A lysine methyltransferase 4
MVIEFDKQSYWSSRFANESSFEWLVPSDTFMAILEPYLEQLPPDARILNVGSGTSPLHNHLRGRGFKGVTNLDYEPLAAQRGTQLEQDAFGDVALTYVVADATQLESLPDHHGKYHLVVDKSTSDAIACAGNEALLSMAQGIKQCLMQGGLWIAMSLSAKRFDVPELPFDVSVIAQIAVPKVRPTDPDIFHWCYELSPK